MLKFTGTTNTLIYPSLALVASIALTPGAAANPTVQQEVESLPQKEEIAAADIPLVTIEEIIVTAQRPIGVLREELEGARYVFYNYYNELNTRDEYDVNCRKTDWTYTRIQTTLCLPVFFDEAAAEEVRLAFITQNFSSFNVRQLARLYRHEFDQLSNNILLVASENPGLANSLAEVGKIEAAIRRKQESCIDQPGFLFFRLCR